MISPELREYAETPGPVRTGSAWVVRDALRRRPRLRVPGAELGLGQCTERRPDEVGALLARTRELITPEKIVTWWIGPSCATARRGRAAAGRQASSTRPTGSSRAIGLALTEQPADIAPGAAVKRIETFDEFVAAREVQWDAFETPAKRRESSRRRFRADFDESLAFGVPVGFLATLDGRAAGTAMSIPSERGVFLVGGATAAWARGRGLYRALVRARWDDAVARGTPALVTQANPNTSYPILKRLGFEDVCEIVRLEDAVQSSKTTSPAS